jgi:hypothetical protein
MRAIILVLILVLLVGCEVEKHEVLIDDTKEGVIEENITVVEPINEVQEEIVEEELIESGLDEEEKGEFDINSPIKFVKHNFIEMDRIKRISKFRSGYGHDYSRGSGEECRSMKHYFWVDGTDPGRQHSPPWTNVKYFSPVDGVIQNLEFSENKDGKEAQFMIKSDEYPSVAFGFFHVALDIQFREGSKVEAGQNIGTIGSEDSHGEISVEIGTSDMRSMMQGRDMESMMSDPSMMQKMFEIRDQMNDRGILSFFDVIDENVFSEYKDKGAVSRSEFIISKQERDENTLNCDENTEEGRFVGVSRNGLMDSTGKNNFIELK